MINQQQFDAKWGEIKGGLRNLWGRLTDEELEQVKGNIFEVADIVQEKYGESKDEIRHKLNQLVDSFDNDTDKDLDPDVSSYQRSPLNYDENEPDIGAQFSESNLDERETSSTSFRSGFGAGTGAGDRQDATLKEKMDFDSDRNARH